MNIDRDDLVNEITQIFENNRLDKKDIIFAIYNVVSFSDLKLILQYLKDIQY